MDYNALIEGIERKALKAARSNGQGIGAAFALMTSLSTDERGEVVAMALSENMDDLERAILVDRMVAGDNDGVAVLIEQAIVRYAIRLIASVLFGDESRSCREISDDRTADIRAINGERGLA
jgi:hypothetical protein